MQKREPAKDMRTSLRGIANRARKDREHRFRHLYTLLNEANLKWCFYQLRRGAAPGIDRITFADYEADLDANLQSLVKRLKEKRYHAKLVRRKYIPKGKDKFRPLGIPVLEDKLLQMAVARVLEAIFDADFLECSWGYRTGRGPQEASKELAFRLRYGRYGWVVEADMRDFFGNISHPWTERMLEERINDGAFLQLIKKWLKAGVMEEDGRVMHPATGTPQGGIVSPVLSNIYLHYVLDLWFEKVVKPQSKGETLVMRFADDFVCAFRHKSDAEQFYKLLSQRLGKFGLEISGEKTRILPFSRFKLEPNEAFEFLGFEFRWVKGRSGQPHVQRRTSPKKLRASVAIFTEWVKTNRHVRISTLMEKLRSKMRGYYNYYGVRGNCASLVKFTHEANRILFKWLNRRSNRRSYMWEGFNELLRQYRIPTPRITEGRQMVMRYS